jgi:Glutamyl-tRNAGlu reductase, dimerisation domain
MSTSLIAPVVDFPRAPFREYSPVCDEHNIAIHRGPTESTGPIVEPGEVARSTSPIHRSAAAAMLRELGGRTESALRRELDRFFSARPDLSPADRVAIARAVSRFRNQLLHHPRRALREVPDDPASSRHLLDAVRNLFDLAVASLSYRADPRKPGTFEAKAS